VETTKIFAFKYQKFPDLKWYSLTLWVVCFSKSVNHKNLLTYLHQIPQWVFCKWAFLAQMTCGPTVDQNKNVHYVPVNCTEVLKLVPCSTYCSCLEWWITNYQMQNVQRWQLRYLQWRTV